MANKTNSGAHTKWMCKYHIVFTPKYRRKVIYVKNLCKARVRDNDTVDEVEDAGVIEA